MQHFDELWKAELESLKVAILKSVDGTVDEQDRFFLLERPLFYSAFIVRKLIEDIGVTDRLRGDWLEIIQHASSRDGNPIFLEPLLGPLMVEDHFNLAEHTQVRVSYSDLTSEIMHSGGLVWIPGNGGIVAFMVFSYRNMLRRLLVVRIDQYLDMLGAVISDQPTRWWSELDVDTGKVTCRAE